eukprot:2757639-Prymnesium_polylepis.1
MYTPPFFRAMFGHDAPSVVRLATAFAVLSGSGATWFTKRSAVASRARSVLVIYNAGDFAGHEDANRREME